MDATRPRAFFCPFFLSCEDKDNPLRSSRGKLSGTETLCLTTQGLLLKDFGWDNGQASDSFLLQKKTQCKETVNIDGSRRYLAHNEKVARWAIWQTSNLICIGSASVEPRATANPLIDCRLPVWTSGSDFPFTCCGGRMTFCWRSTATVRGQCSWSQPLINAHKMPSCNADVEFWCVHII